MSVCMRQKETLTRPSMSREGNDKPLFFTLSDVLQGCHILYRTFSGKTAFQMNWHVFFLFFSVSFPVPPHFCNDFFSFFCTSSVLSFSHIHLALLTSLFLQLLCRLLKALTASAGAPVTWPDTTKSSPWSRSLARPLHATWRRSSTDLRSTSRECTPVMRGFPLPAHPNHFEFSI